MVLAALPRIDGKRTAGALLMSHDPINYPPSTPWRIVTRPEAGGETIAHCTAGQAQDTLDRLTSAGDEFVTWGPA